LESASWCIVPRIKEEQGGASLQRIAGMNLTGFICGLEIRDRASLKKRLDHH
jgi:hypothetical protein